MHAEVGRFGRKRRIVDIVLSMYALSTEILGEFLMSLERSNSIESRRHNKSGDLRRLFDLLRQDEDLWDLFTRREEYSSHRDCYERFPYYLSNNRCVFQPEVSKFLINNGFKVEYPEGKKFAICLTHDIDFVRYPLTRTIPEAVMFLFHLQIKDAFSRPFYVIKNCNPFWNFRDIMNLEEKYGAKSTFYFMSLEKGDIDFNYSAEDLSQEMGDISDRGFEVGLHGGHKAFDSLEVLHREKNLLEKAMGKKVIGYRNHFLRFKVPDTWELLKEAGFKYDATLGYADCLGFRNGMCHPFKPFNLKSNKEIDIIEIPLVLMDGTMDATYMRLDAQTAWRLTKGLIDTAQKYQGMITILWHNTYMVGERLKFYEKILDYGNEKDAWMTSAEDIYKFWIKQ